MNHLPTEIIENDIHYTLHGEYYFSDITIPESEKRAIGRYGRLPSFNLFQRFQFRQYP